jgi:putative endonuclease
MRVSNDEPLLSVKAQLYWVYILHCENNSYYAGYTTDLARRFQEHLAGTAGCKYTRSFKPLGIAQSWQVSGNKSMAMKVERYIKKIPRREKLTIIQYPEVLVQVFAAELRIHHQVLDNNTP